MQEHAKKAILAVCNSSLAYFKFLPANETGENGGHPAGIAIAKSAAPILFDSPCSKGQNKEKRARIRWQDGSETDSRFIYYGKGTKDEYWITNFGRNFPYLQPEYTGGIFVLVKSDAGEYFGFVLNTEEDMEEFLVALQISPVATEELINVNDITRKLMPYAYR